jgi:ParB-like chromosome segregation protein Spo0J
MGNRARPLTAKERAAQLIEESTELTAEDLTDDRQTQTRGAMGVAKSYTSALPIEATRTEDLSRLIFRPGYERDDSELHGPEWDGLLESLRVSGMNDMPIDVREVRNPTGYPPGVYYEVLAGERRTRALRALNKTEALVHVRRCDDREADRIHEVENRHRLAKAPYSRGALYLQMQATGRYGSLREMAEHLEVGAGHMSTLITLISDAPAGMWDKVSDRANITFRDAAVLKRAYERPAFVRAVQEAEHLTRAQLMVLANASLARPKKAENTTLITERKVRGRYVLVLPPEITQRARKQSAELLTTLLSLEEGERAKALDVVHRLVQTSS